MDIVRKPFPAAVVSVVASLRVAEGSEAALNEQTETTITGLYYAHSLGPI
jgi:hypothetical protein